MTPAGVGSTEAANEAERTLALVRETCLALPEVS